MAKIHLITLGASLATALGLGLGAASAGQEPRTGTLRHVVSFKFKSSATPEQVRGVVTAFRALPRKISKIRGFEWGTDVSPEGLAKGFTHCFILTFETAEDRDAYLVHPDHEAFGEIVGPVLEDVFVVDFWAEG